MASLSCTFGKLVFLGPNKVMTYKRRRKRKPAAPVRKTDRRWRVPPPLTHGPEPLEGGTILEELRDPLAVVLWEAARDVSLWVSTPTEERGEIFGAGAMDKRRQAVAALAAGADVSDAVLAVSSILNGDADSDTIADACQAIAKWAESETLPGVALVYGQAVALIRDTDPRIAFEVGVLARRRSEDARAETWFRRAIMLAHQNGDWTAYSQAFLALGDLYIDRESYSSAKKFHVRASRAAKRHSLHVIEEKALAALALIAEKTGETGDVPDDQESRPKGSRPRRSGRARE